MKSFALGGAVSLEIIDQVSRHLPVVLPASARAKVAASRRSLQRAMASGGAIYGVNTGYGELASKRIPANDILELQRNYVRSHSSGVGELLSIPQSRAIVFLRANELAKGHSGCRPELVEALTAMINRGVIPCIPSRGSVGASGDLAPMAHMALTLMGEGRAHLVKGKTGARVLPAAQALRQAGLKPVTLEAKEGLCLNNGTQAMQAVGGLALYRAFRIFAVANLAGAMSLEALRGSPGPYDQDLIALKPHPGQLQVAAALRELLKGSEIRESHRHNDPRVQDPYSLRCIPQVHGSIVDCLRFAEKTLLTETASVTDNPIVSGSRVISGGNFHGQGLSFAFDMAAIALTSLGNISERRTFLLTAGQELPVCLADAPGLESGLMIPQYVAAALASENKGLAHPASVDSIPTSANKEDFVSMGMGAALKLDRVVDNVAQIIAIELLSAAKGVELRRPLKAGKGVEKGLARLRESVPAVKGDATWSEPMMKIKELILEGRFADIK